MYLVTLKSEYYNVGTMYTFDELDDALSYIEKAISRGVASSSGDYPIATIQFVKDD